MKVYTKTGDKGTTRLIGGDKVSKASLQVEAYGNIDELKSYLGLVYDLFDDTNIKNQLQQIIIKLFTAESLVASATIETANKMPRLTEEDVIFLEKQIDAMDKQLEPLKAFVLPGGSLINSHCNIARAICRRTERACIRFWETDEKLQNDMVAKYLNRLSDYLFTLSRYSLKIKGEKENLWLP